MLAYLLLLNVIHANVKKIQLLPTISLSSYSKIRTIKGATKPRRGKSPQYISNYKTRTNRRGYQSAVPFVLPFPINFISQRGSTSRVSLGSPMADVCRSVKPPGKKKLRRVFRRFIFTPPLGPKFRRKINITST